MCLVMCELAAERRPVVSAATLRAQLLHVRAALAPLLAPAASLALLLLGLLVPRPLRRVLPRAAVLPLAARRMPG